MAVIKEQYEALAPQGASLADVVVLAQAWKKSHVFIRRHNWYADVLELDASTINLEERLLEWANDVASSRFRPQALLLVPAPKNAKWIFCESPRINAVDGHPNRNKGSLGEDALFDDWRPSSRGTGEQGACDIVAKTELRLRPLAHLTIRDQTLATAVMMCLAEAVESAQGDTSDGNLVAERAAGVVSYGNRLHCNWERSPALPPRARCSWGNSRTYRQYFQDYRSFLARPRRVCAELMTQITPRRELYIVSLDIKSFFDEVDTNALLGELRLIESDFRKVHNLPDRQAADTLFWRRAKRIFKWRWRAAEHSHVDLIGGSKDGELPLGLPQGLVASGFLANAYLVRFDKDMHQAAAQGADLGGDIKLFDYCRYVDDMRVVVEARSERGGAGQRDVLEQVIAYVASLLQAHCRRVGASHMLKLSPDKCTIAAYRSLSAQSHMSAMMEMLSAELSGTFDMESLAQAAGGLDGLLSMSDRIDHDAEPKPSRLSLATVAVPSTDVRDDTVKRFVATRLAQVMRHRLAMTDTAATIDTGDAQRDQLTNGRVLAHEFESTARKFIKCWADNPALALLLRCGFDLYPHPRLLAPVVEALEVKLFKAPEDLDVLRRREVKVAEYVLADLLRAGAVETGFRDAEEYPEDVDVTGYREELGAMARRVLLDRQDSPWYLQQQARLFLASISDMSVSADVGAELVELHSYAALQRAGMYESACGAALGDALPSALVAQQLHPNPRRFGAWLADGLGRTQDEVLQGRVIRAVSLDRPDLMMAALNGRKATAWRRLVPRAVTETLRRSASSRRSSARKSAKASLLHLMLESDNLFGQENSILLLAVALLKYPGIEDRLSNGLSASDIVLRCEDWERVSALPTAPGFLSVESLGSSDAGSPLYGNPPWVADDRAWLYGLGRVLRAALTGELDFTSRRFLVTEDIGRYAGLRSTWFKRRFGLLNSGRGLLDEPGPVSPWLSGMLSTLLQWPGVDFRASDIASAGRARTAYDMLSVFESRIAFQRALFGCRSQTPMYVIPADDHAPLEDRPLRVAIVQPMRPRRDEFDCKDLLHWTPGVLAAHRRHLAEICRLTAQKLKTWASASAAACGSSYSSSPVVDLVLFPELSVHYRHISLLRRLSDQIGANIFTGLTFQFSPKVCGVVNQGLWLIRTTSPGHGRSFQYVYQGKLHPMKLEAKMGVKGHRPHLTLVELPIGSKTRTRVAAVICYDATDLDLVADLRERSDMFLVAALNQDVQTFDNMIAALHFHMYQPVVLANSGEFGGSTAQAPLPQHDKLLAHIHGSNQVAVSVFEVDPSLFKSASTVKVVKVPKWPPAGYKGRP